MTYKEKLQIEHPDMIAPQLRCGCHGCPNDYGYGPERRGNKSCQGSGGCEACWNKEFAFSKEDIKPCFLIKLRNGLFRDVISVGKRATLIALNHSGDWDYLSAWDDGFNYKKGAFEAGHPRKHSDYAEKDIVEVYGLVESTEYYCTLNTNYNSTHRPLLWKRTEAKKMTVAEINAALGYEVEIVAEKE